MTSTEDLRHVSVSLESLNRRQCSLRPVYVLVMALIVYILRTSLLYEVVIDLDNFVLLLLVLPL